MRIMGFNNYEIYPETGQIWSYTSNRYIGTKGLDGYWRCAIISDDGKRENWLMHRLIWVIINGEIPNDLQINHIDENKDNNSIFNLALVTCKENNNWGTHNERMIKNQKSKPIIALKDGNPKMYFKSIREANRNGYHSFNIAECCKGNYNNAYGYQWKYLDDILGDWLEEIQDEDMKNERAA